jgi:hypothetical protein
VKAALNFFARPRYLRAIPSLVLLTTAMAWGMAPDMTDGDGDGAQKKARVTLAQNLSQSVTPVAGLAPGLAKALPGPSAPDNKA